MKNILVIGSGGHANSCIDVLLSTKKFKILGVILKDKKTINKTQIKKTFLSTNLKKLTKKCKNAHISIGMIKNYQPRLKAYNEAKKLGYKFPIIISSESYVSNSSKLAEGIIVMHGSIINTNVIIKENSIINTRALIEHDVKIGRNCHISTGAIINGGSKIGDNTFIGSGAIVSNNIIIGNNCLISAGSFIKRNLSNNTIYKYEKK